MAPRPAWILTVLLALVAAGPGTALLADMEAPTDLERILQKKFLDRHFILRADVKVQKLRSRQVVSSTFPRPKSVDAIRAITVVTPEGVFYTRDYSAKRQVEGDVRAGVAMGPDQMPSEIMPGDNAGQVGDVVELSGQTLVVQAQGELIRITGLEEAPGGVRVTLEGISSDPAEVLLRREGPESSPAAVAAERYTAVLAHLIFLLPEDPAERKEWIDPAWSEGLRTAIQEGRILQGMDHLQVLLAWGTPAYVHSESDGSGQVWTFQRGGSLMDQLRNKTRVYFVAGQVADVESSTP
jgi:hypothetical protein